MTMPCSSGIEPKFRVRLRRDRRSYPLTPCLMDTPKKRGAFRFALREGYVSYLDVEAATEAEAVEKVRAFYATHRRPQSSLSVNGVNAVLDTHSVSCVRKPKSTWGKPRAAARGNDRGAGNQRNDVASSEIGAPAPTTGVSEQKRWR
jgi:hypothetical protein